MFIKCSTCFEQHTAHHQELKNCNCSLWLYIRLWLPAAVKDEWELQRPATTGVCKTRGCNYNFWAPDDERCVARNMLEHLINTEIINSRTRLHLVGYFCMIYARLCLPVLHEPTRCATEFLAIWLAQVSKTKLIRYILMTSQSPYHSLNMQEFSTIRHNTNSKVK